MYKMHKDCFKRMQIIRFVDNDENKWGKTLDGIFIISPEQILEIEFDYIILVSVHYSQMRAQLLQMKIDERKIIDKEHQGPFENLRQTENYIFYSDIIQPNVLLISHALDLTGAPIALCEVAHVLKRNGYKVTVCTEKNDNVSGELLYELIQDKISVILYENMNSMSIPEDVSKYDCIWVNTVTLSDIVRRLIPTGIDIYWWLHEAEDYYKDERYGNAKMIASNLHVLSAGWLARQTYEKYTDCKVEKVFLYGLKDIENVDKGGREHSILRCGVIGAYCDRKGQDVLISAIKQHPEWKRIEYIFVGKDTDKIKKKTCNISNIKCMGEVIPSEVAKLYDKLDIVICPSLNDPMPIVVSEAMQHKKMCLVTQNVGQSRYITDGMDGLVCKAGSVESLSEKIQWILEHRELVGIIGEHSYKIYESYFAYSIFEKNILQLMNKFGERYINL